MTTAPLASCAICAGALQRDPCAISGESHYRRCDRCGTAQLHPQPTATQLASFYERYHASIERGYDRYEPRTAADFPAKASLLRALCAAGNRRDTPLRLLDVGCGSGAFLRAAASSGFHAEGIDLSQAATERARAAGLLAHTGDLTSDTPPAWRQAFDAVTLLATIEHLPDPVATLRAARTCLAPGGVLLLDTGLANAGLECLLPGYSQWYEAPEHLFVFSERGLIAALDAAGLVPAVIDRNWDRTRARRWMRYVRHAGICLAAYVATRPLLGSRAFQQCRQQSKWPIGRLILMVARPVASPSPA